MLIKISLVLCSLCFLSCAATSFREFEETPIRPGYVGTGLKKFRDFYNQRVTKITREQNAVRKNSGQGKAMPHEEWFGQVGLQHSCEDFVKFMSGDLPVMIKALNVDIGDSSANVGPKQLNCMKIGLTYRLTPDNIIGFQNGVLDDYQTENILSIFGFLLHDVISEAVCLTDKGTAKRKTLQDYLDNGVAQKVNMEENKAKKIAFLGILTCLRNLNLRKKQQLEVIMEKLVNDNIEYYLRQGFLSVGVFGYAESALTWLGGFVGTFARSYFYPSDDSSSYLRRGRDAAIGFGVGKVAGRVFKKLGSRLARGAQNYFYYDAIRQNAGNIIQGMMVADGKKSD
jgi:hypothetical protein